MKNDTQISIENDAHVDAHDQVREFASTLLAQVADPQKIAEALAYIAVEMSLQLAENKLCVMPILMNSMSQAAYAYELEKEKQNNGEVQPDGCEQPNVILH